MPTRYADAVWKGSLKEGAGTVKLESGLLDTGYNFVSRFETGDQTNPEELLGAAQAGCYAMFLAALLSGDDFTVNEVKARADVTVDSTDDGPTITVITLTVTASVDAIEEAAFLEYAEKAKAGCPISKALASVATINLNATLVG